MSETVAPATNTVRDVISTLGVNQQCTLINGYWSLMCECEAQRWGEREWKWPEPFDWWLPEACLDLGSDRSSSGGTNV